MSFPPCFFAFRMIQNDSESFGNTDFTWNSASTFDSEKIRMIQKKSEKEELLRPACEFRKIQKKSEKSERFRKIQKDSGKFRKIQKKSE